MPKKKLNPSTGGKKVQEVQPKEVKVKEAKEKEVVVPIQVEDAAPKEDKAEVVKKPASKTSKSKPKKIKSKKYLESQKNVNKGKVYPLAAALELVKKMSYTKFDGTVELHIATLSKKDQDPLRGLVTLTAGNPKQRRIAVADESTIEKVKSGKIDFDILLASPDLMPKLATVAKILGPKGLMPSPKSGTVVTDPKATLEEFAKGKVEYKSDVQGVIHIPVGKVSWTVDKLTENIQILINVIPTNRVKSIFVSATMSPSVKIR